MTWCGITKKTHAVQCIFFIVLEKKYCFSDSRTAWQWQTPEWKFEDAITVFVTCAKAAWICCFLSPPCG